MGIVSPIMEAFAYAWKFCAINYMHNRHRIQSVRGYDRIVHDSSIIGWVCVGCEHKKLK